MTVSFNWPMRSGRIAVIAASTVVVLFGGGCGGGGNNTAVNPPVLAPVSVSITPTSATVPVGTSQPFSAFAMDTANSAVSWSASAGTIDSSGNYIAPASVPAGEIAIVTATSISTPSASASATVTITAQPLSVSISPASSNVKAGLTQLYVANVVGTTNTSITWSVTDLPGDSGFPGSVSYGLYTGPAPILTPQTFSIIAVSNADSTKTASASVTVTPLENEEGQTFPIKLGASGVNANAGDCCSGTLGSLLSDQNGKQYILSNNHIMGRVGNAAVGEAIVQPGFVDTFCNFSLPNTVAHFTAAPPIDSNVDAAIAEVVPGAVATDGEIIGLGGIASDGSYIPAPPASTTATATVGMPVAKSGRTTGLSCAVVQGIDGDILVDLPAECGNPVSRNVPFSGQVVTGRLVQPGDSGSLIVEAATSRPLALVAGVTEDLQFTTANPVSDVLAALDSTTGLTLSFVGAGDHAISCSPELETKSRTLGSNSTVQHDSLSSDEISRAILVKRKYKDLIMRDPAVLGIAVGRSEIRHERASILIFVQRGRNLSMTAPSMFDGFEVRILPTDRFEAQARSTTDHEECRFGIRSLLRVEP